MEYGKPFGIGASGSVAILGFNLGYGWIVTGALVVTAVSIVGIRYFFRRNKPLGLK